MKENILCLWRKKSSKLKCAFCQGKGRQPGAERLSCIVCGGSGQVTVMQPYNICKECGGRGKKAGANLYCLLCHGRGFVGEGRRYPLAAGVAESPSPKTKREKRKRRKSEFRKKLTKKSKRKIRNKKPITAKIIKAEVVEVKKSFFKKLFSAIKIL